MHISSLYLISIIVSTLWMSFASAAPFFAGQYRPGPGFIEFSEFFTDSDKARCLTGTIAVPINNLNKRYILIPPLTRHSQERVADMIRRLFLFTFLPKSWGWKRVSGVANLSSVVCLPNTGGKVNTIQILTHGMGVDKSYWNITAGNSYVEEAIGAGYATLSYDRLGVGDSDHPDPVNVVQSFAHVSILHGIVEGLRESRILTNPFRNVVGVGHGYGSIIQLANNAKYPSDMNATIITGASDTLEYLRLAAVSNTPAIAKLDDSRRFRHLKSGYLVDPDSLSIRKTYFWAGRYSEAVFDAQVARKETYSIGDEFTLPEIFEPALNYTGPVNVVLAQHDLPFCGGDCRTAPRNRAERVLDKFYPQAQPKIRALLRDRPGSQYFLVKDSGHLINDHTHAKYAYKQMLGFLKANGLSVPTR